MICMILLVAMFANIALVEADTLLQTLTNDKKRDQ